MGPYMADPKKIVFYFPWLFLIATAIGAAMGAIVSVYRLKRSAPRSRRRYTSDWLVGFIIGVGATAMAYAGMHLPEWIPMPAALVGEVAPFALAFICSAASVLLIETIIPFHPASGG
jgi:NO-binding membrane sensor protein with MHYT domain